MNFRIVVLICLFFPMVLWAQKKQKPRLLVYGSDITAFSAALQAAKSNVPTIWVVDEENMLPEFRKGPLKINNNEFLDAGIWMELLMKMAMSNTTSDSLAQVVKKDFNNQLAWNAAEKMLSAFPDLKIVKNQQAIKVTRNKRNWAVQLSNKEQYVVHSLIDASYNSDLVKQVVWKEKSTPSTSFLKPEELTLALSRTTLGVAALDTDVRMILLKDILSFEQDNLFDVGLLRKLKKGEGSIAFQSVYGQVLGATAGFVAFFKTESKQIDVRKLQTELMTYKMRMMPYQDVLFTNVHYQSLQKLFLTGFFLGENKDGKYQLNADDYVQFSEIKAVMNDMYTRSQLWFLDNYREDEMQWKDLLSLIKFIFFRGDEVEKQLVKDWNSKRKFEGQYQAEQRFTKTQFAVMTDLYSDSFAKGIKEDGSFKK
ncbi:FAD-dependent oxidoreductase [Sphingobacterium sp. HJSM2_6]|uniref:FAD-dependent oxidoreductase n=1 Tax=Sphingobacterium sp. HJSM2_6 TaxID=3366264 RepID=UPI003BEAAE6D